MSTCSFCEKSIYAGAYFGLCRVCERSVKLEEQLQRATDAIHELGARIDMLTEKKLKDVLISSEDDTLEMDTTSITKRDKDDNL